jgi:glycerophosphoryl diester phosphodiesterase
MTRFALSIVVCLLFASPAAANPWLERKPLNIAHQGGEDEFPSNTFFAYKNALDIGADMLEMDVNITKDRQAVVMHDTHLGRMGRPDENVNDHTLAELRELDAAYTWPEYRGIATGERPPPKGFTADDFKIPTLESVVEAYPKVLMNIEIKGPAPDHADAPAWLQQTAAGKPTAHDNAQVIADVLNRHLATRRGRTIVVSFADSALEVFRARAPEIDVATGLETTAAFWASAQGPLPGVSDSRHIAVQPPLALEGITVVTEDFIADAHASGLAVHPWTINDEGDMRTLLDWDADGIMTDRPSLLEAILRERRCAAKNGAFARKRCKERARRAASRARRAARLHLSD